MSTEKEIREHLLRKELFALLSWHMHSTEAHPGETLSRLYEKSTGCRENFSRKLRVVDAHITINELSGLQDASVERGEPNNMDSPVILTRHSGRLFIIDGQKRIYHWRSIATPDQPLIRCLCFSWGGDKHERD